MKKTFDSQAFAAKGRIFQALAFLGALLCSVGAATAQEAFVIERVRTVTVSPVVADVNVARQITISGNWPGCPPSGATLHGAVYTDLQVLPLKLVPTRTFLPCPLGMSYSVSITFTPNTRGIYRLPVFDENGAFLGEGQLDVRAPDEQHSAFNVTGMWFDPLSTGSGVTFVHSKSADNAVFGTWYVYDSAGKALWYTIQDAVWKSQGRVMEGTLYKTTATATCNGPLTACPAPLGRLAVAGRVRLTLTGSDSARIDALGLDGTPMFFSNLVKAEI